jgi:recombination protein RecR
MYSPSINNLIRALKRLPTVGQRTAERFAFYLLKSGKKEVTELMLALRELIENVKSCEICWNFSDTSPCPIDTDPKRDRSTVCIVQEPQDLFVIDQTGAYHGVYHVLRGLLDPSDEESSARMKAKELFERVRGTVGYHKETPIKEVILALNPDMAGETTMLYLERELKTLNPEVIVTRLARGLPLGADVRYADEITLGSAIKNRVTKG